MTIRQIAATVTVAGPDAYSTPVTFTQGQVLDIASGSYWDTALGGNAPVLVGSALVSTQTGSAQAATANS